ncbi:MAG: DUF805 domain-containing protein [Selenomonas ruminantium]|nr:DUF805 domain-containing protein [Selenomonas ruminantium]
MKKCTQCGQILEESLRFCPMCGAMQTDVVSRNASEVSEVKKILKEMTNFKGRMNRKPFACRMIPISLIYNIVIFLLIVLMDYLLNINEESYMIFFQMGVCGFVTGFLTPCYFCYHYSLIFRRCHDLDEMIWPIVLMEFIPVFNLYPLIKLFCIKGTTGSNRFGEDPLA